ncbi:DMT family transporter [Pseudopelagicola sp. nBUS_19]|uniref:DMT family transporter n=1 Tax=unclassified Pseudopelagicola TaxID=2649563 RepID=UPI003EBE9D33
MDFKKTRVLGLAAALTTVTIWAVFLLGTRFAVQGNFTVEEIVLMRLLPGALIMSPFMCRLGVWPRGQSIPRAAMLMVGASAVFPFVVSKGLSYAPASDGGALAPGMLPFWTALAAYALAGEIPGQRRWYGLTMILAGAFVVSLWQIFAGAHDGAWRGHLMFLAGSGLWGIYSVIFRQSGLSSLHALVIGLFWGTLLFVPLLLASGKVSFESANLQDIAVMIIFQSFVIGILAMFLFGYAVRIIGAAEAAAFGALTPIFALLGGAYFLAETITTFKVLGVALVAGGVFLASGVTRNSDHLSSQE